MPELLHRNSYHFSLAFFISEGRRNQTESMFILFFLVGAVIELLIVGIT